MDGAAAHNDLVIDVAGTYTLTATDGTLAPATSAPFAVTLAPNTVSGHVFDDTDNSGTMNAGDTAAGCRQCDAHAIGETTGSPVTVATTGDGFYIFPNVNPGRYSVSESLFNGYALTAPAGGLTAVTVTAGQPSIGPTFGNVLISSVTLNFNMLVALSQDYNKPGTFANGDLNGDGMVDFNDLALLSQNYNQTLPPGVYSFSGMTSAAVSASCAIDRPGRPSPGMSSASVSGTVYNDANGDAVHQSGEKGLGGRTVDLEIAGQQTKGERTTTTNSQGAFSFVNLPAGNYVLIVPAPAGWRSTNGSAGGDHLMVKAGSKTSGLLFGQQIIPPFSVWSARVTDPLDHTKDLVTFYARNNGVGASAGTRDIVALDASLSSAAGLLIRTYDGDGSGKL